MNSEEKKNQEQVNTEDTQEQTQQQEQQQNEETVAQEQTQESEQGNGEQTQEKKESGSQKKEKSKKKEEKGAAGEKEKTKDKEGKKGKKQEEQEAEAEQEVKEEEKEKEKAEEKSDKEKLAELQDKYLRLNAEYDNYRKRTLKEKMELTRSAGEDLLKGLLPIMDDFERALQSIDDAGDNQAVKDGVHLIYNKFKEFLKQQGVQEIEAQDKEFDTDKHEAISKVPAQEEDQKGKVMDVVQKGYYLNDKVLRYAKVVVGE